MLMSLSSVCSFQRGPAPIIRPTIPNYLIEDEDSDDESTKYGSVGGRFQLSRRQLANGKQMHLSDV